MCSMEELHFRGTHLLNPATILRQLAKLKAKPHNKSFNKDLLASLLFFLFSYLLIFLLKRRRFSLSADRDMGD